MRDADSVTPNEQAEHFKRSKNWEASYEAQRDRSEARAWRFSLVSWAITAISVTGIAVIGPMKRTVPYMFALDKSAGNVEFVEAVDERKIMGYQELLDKHMAQRYVLARESYNYRLLQGDYDTVLGLSTDDVFRTYASQFEGPDALDSKLGANQEIKSEVISVQLSQNAAGKQAVVRFAKTPRRVDTNTSEPTQYYVATLAYRFLPTMFGKEKDLLVNPLGYKVNAYRRDAELAPVVPALVKAAGQ